MRPELLSREQEILRLLRLLAERQLRFVVVGGYAVATFRKRFSVDLDLAVAEKDFPKFVALFKEQGYAETVAKAIATIYGERFQRMEREVGGYPVAIDLLVNGVVARGTGASWSDAFLAEHSTLRVVEGVRFPVPERELLIAMKVHSGRLSDVRDIAALAEGADAGKAVGYALRGDKEATIRLLKQALGFLESRNFADGFKGVFGAQAYGPALVPAAVGVLRDVQKALG